MRAAILFTAYSWEPFVHRQLGRLHARAGGLDIVVGVDALGPSARPSYPEKCLRVTRDTVARAVGVPGADVELLEEGEWGRPPLLWWNLDFYFYAFFDAYPEVDYCLVLDFDAWVHVDIPRLMERVAARGIDFVGMPHDDVSRWSWTAPHLAIYPADLLRGAMLPIVVVSRRAGRHLRRRRTEMARERQAGRLPFWPFCEAFVATELACVGFRTASLAEFGDTSRLRWRPFFPEEDVIVERPAGFIHPIRPA